MTKEQAVLELMNEARSDRAVSQAAANRSVRACKILGVDPITICAYLDFCSPVDGRPYMNLKPTWQK